MKKIVSVIWDLIIVSRPIGWIIHALPFIAGLIVSRATVTPIVLLQLFSLTLPLGLFAYTLNDTYDKASDLVNKRKTGGLLNQPIKPYIEKNVAIVSLAGLVIVAAISIATTSVANMFIVLFGLFLGYAYSTPPLRFKTKPPLEIISNALSAVCLFLAGITFGQRPINTLYPHVIFLFVWALSLSLLASIADVRADSIALHASTATKLGYRTSVAIFVLLQFLLIGIWTFVFGASYSVLSAATIITICIWLCIACIALIRNSLNDSVRLYIINLGVFLVTFTFTFFVYILGYISDHINMS